MTLAKSGAAVGAAAPCHRVQREPARTPEERTMTVSDSTRERALRLLAEGCATLTEVAELAGTSRQLVRFWANRAGIDWATARDRHLRALWRETKPASVRPTKAAPD